jgi:HEAT repeat protein
MREDGMNERTVGTLAILGLLTAGPAAAQGTASDPALQELSNPSTRARIQALQQLGDAARVDAAVPMAALLLDGNDNVQYAAITSLVKLYTVRADLSKRQWGAGASGTPPTTLPELAFEAGPLATMPAAVPAEVLSNLSSLVRQDESGRIRLSAAYALGVLGSPAMGPMAAGAVQTVTTNTVYALSHRDVPTRQVVARIAGRMFAPDVGTAASAAVGDALIGAMNDKDPLVRRWAMDSLGLLKYDRAIQGLMDHASYYGKGEEGKAALHALARIANPASAPVLRALLANAYLPFRVIAIEGLGRIGDKAAVPQIGESASSANDASVNLATAFAYFLLGQADVVAVADALEKPDTTVQAKVYLAEIAMTRPAAIHPLLKTPNPSTRMIAVELLGTCRQPGEQSVLQPLLQDPAPEVVEVTGEALRRLAAGVPRSTK